MDFSAVCLDGMLGISSSNGGKHLRAGSEMDQQEWRALKMARTSSVMSDGSRLEGSNNSGGAADLLESADQATARLMRSDSIVSPFSSNSSNNGKSLSLPFYNHSGGGATYQYAAGGAQKATGLHGMLAGARISPFTASQWQELEHQALIFRCMMTGIQVPPELLIPIRKPSNMNMNMNVNLFSNLSGVGSLRPNLGWSSFHLGYGQNADPEPGRCRRTDGKKWRCSRDAVPDQKYCERHMNRGRHRSRKPVEGQTQTNPNAVPTAATASGAAISSANSLAPAAARSAVTPNTTTSTNGPNTSSFSNLRPSQQQLKPPSSAYTTMDAPATPFQIPLNVDRYLFEPAPSFNDSSAWRSSSSSRIAAAATATAQQQTLPKTTTNLMGFETRIDDAPDFGLGRRSAAAATGGGGIRHFFDDWPLRSAAAATQTTASATTATQLSISIPSDFSPASSPSNKLTLSPLKLSTSRSDDPLGVDVVMGLAIEPENRHRQQTQNHWIPIAWESPVGGPLAEVLNSTPHEKINNSSSVLNLMTGDCNAGWDCSSSGSPRGDNSPTGVLQKTLGSLSDNSSTGSSPRALKCENLRTAAFAQQLSST